MSAQWGPEVIDAAARELVIGVRVGQGHRFTPVWSVVVDGRIFARSWSLSPDGWNATLPERSEVAVEIGGVEIAATAVRVRDERLNDLVDAMYRTKYHTPASAEYAEGLASTERRATTIEFLPR